MDLDYAETIRQQTALIFDRGPGLLDLPEWPAEMHGAENDKQALKNSHKKIEQAGWDPANFTGKPKKIVLLVGRKGKLISAANLFTFTQVTLARHSTYLESQGITVHVAPPERTI